VKLRFIFIFFIFIQFIYAFDVAIDIGHTKKYYGAISARGEKEYTFNHAIATLLFQKLQKQPSIHPFLINPSGEEIVLTDRTKIANDRHVDLFIALHHDSAQPKYLKTWDYKDKSYKYSDKFSGYSLFVSSKNLHYEKSVAFASIVGKTLKKNGFTPTLHHAEPIKGENRKLINKNIGLYDFDDLIVLKTSNAPALLIECGIIINRKDELMLKSKKFQEKFTDAIIESIAMMINLNSKL
jgi:N-acetylmuramoyl-L-alanine amidase